VLSEALLVLVSVLPGADAVAPQAPPVEREVAAMGTRLRVVVSAAERATAFRASEAAVAAVEAAEQRLSTWRTDTELARLNAAPVGEPFAMSPELARDLDGAAHWFLASGGAFDPGVGALVDAFGLRHGGRIPDAAELAQARAATGFPLLERRGAVAVRRHPGLRIEEGGFGKGAALDDALAAACAAGATGIVLDFGGQLALRGGAPLWVGLAHPGARERAVGEVLLAGGSIATSGNSERGVTVGGQSLGHLLDPRTGQPAPDWGSLTVLAPTALAADCLSKLYVLGPDKALAAAEAIPGVDAVALVRQGDEVAMRATPSLCTRLRALAGTRAPTFAAARPQPERTLQ
jgi:thiamine biosynthesis lipoprotein